MLPLGESQEILKARPSISTLKSGKHITGVLCSQNPVPPFSSRLNYVGGADEVPIFKASELISSIVAKHDADAGPSSDRNSAEVGGYRLVKALLLSPYDPDEVEIGMAFPVEINICGVQHLCAPVGSPYGVIRNFTRNQRCWYRTEFLVNFRLIESCFLEKLVEGF